MNKVSMTSGYNDRKKKFPMEETVLLSSAGHRAYIT